MKSDCFCLSEERILTTTSSRSSTNKLNIGHTTKRLDSSEEVRAREQAEKMSSAAANRGRLTEFLSQVKSRWSCLKDEVTPESKATELERRRLAAEIKASVGRRQFQHSEQNRARLKFDAQFHPKKDAFKRAEQRLTCKHFSHLKKGVQLTLVFGSMHQDQQLSNLRYQRKLLRLHQQQEQQRPIRFLHPRGQLQVQQKHERFIYRPVVYHVMHEDESIISGAGERRRRRRLLRSYTYEAKSDFLRTTWERALASLAGPVTCNRSVLRGKRCYQCRSDCVYTMVRIFSDLSPYLLPQQCLS